MKTCPSCSAENLPGEEECQQCQAPLAQLDLPQATKGMQKRILEGKIIDLVPHAAVMVAPDDVVSKAVEAMRAAKVGCVLVAEKNRLAGILTERDLLMKLSGLAEPGQQKVRDVMKANPESLKDTDSIALAFHKMAVGGFRHLPVERQDGPPAIISARDLLRYLCR